MNRSARINNIKHHSITDKKKWVINISSRQLTHIETDLLLKGLNFSITSKALPNKDIIAAIEDAGPPPKLKSRH